MMFLLGQRRNNNAQKKEILGDENLELPFVSFGDIVIATNIFSEANMLGEGGFGKVYKVAKKKSSHNCLMRFCTIF